jgi:hypothetical protein
MSAVIYETERAFQGPAAHREFQADDDGSFADVLRRAPEEDALR